MGPFHPYARHAPPPPPRRTEGKAVASLLLGLFSLTCLGAFAGLPAIILGAMARRDIDRSNGWLVGRGLAAGGIVSGLFGTGFGFVLLLWVLSATFAPSAAEPTAAIAPLAAPPPSAVVAPAPPTEPSAPLTSPISTRSYGSLEVIDLDQSRPLRSQLGEIVQRIHAEESGSPRRTIVLQTYVRSSSACAAIDAALPDTRMQRALANVTLVRVDVDEYDRELGAMKVETKTAPWFYKLDAKGAPTDAISADAWEHDAPENMAPVLGKFMRRSAPARGKPGGPR
jgi:hypothetical protein